MYIYFACMYLMYVYILRTYVAHEHVSVAYMHICIYAYMHDVYIMYVYILHTYLAHEHVAVAYMHICIYANIHACISTLSIYTSYLRRARTRSRWPPAHREAAAGVRLRQNSRISVKIFKYRDIEAIGFADSQNTVPPPHAHTLTERERERERESVPVLV